MPRLLVVALCTGALLLAACRPVVVEVAIDGAQKLPLAGEAGVTGVVTATLAHGGVRVAKGSAVRVEETWLLRHDKGARPPGYRISGRYDPSTEAEGLSLPRHAVDVYYLSALLPEAKVRVPIPARHFERR